jgi:hypothetical protein
VTSNMWLREAEAVAINMTKRAAAVYAAPVPKDWPSYTTDGGKLTLRLVYSHLEASWRWELDGVPIRHGKAVKLIAERMQSKLG